LPRSWCCCNCSHSRIRRTETAPRGSLHSGSCCCYTCKSRERRSH
jgi:hypothetical protein